MKVLHFLLPALILASCGSNPKIADYSYDENGKIYPVSKVESITIDGDKSDWEKQGTECRLIAGYDGKIIVSKDLEASFKIGWNDSTLLVMAEVKDDSLVTLDKRNSDGIELFIIDKAGGKNKLQYIINLNRSDSGKTVSIANWDHRGSRKISGTPIDISVMAKTTDSSYCIEAAIPFRYLGLDVNNDKELGFELVVNDVDNENSIKQQVSWSYLQGAYMNNFAMNRICLTDDSKENIECITRAYILDRDTARIIVCGLKDMVGKTVILRDSSDTLAETIMKESMGFSTAEFSFPVKDSMYYPLAVFVDNKLAGVIDLNITDLEFKRSQIYPHESYVRILLRKQYLNPAPENPILFIGHSMFRYWHTFEDDMQGFTAINRAFGGSRAEHVVLWYDKLVKPYNPKAIVYFEGGNDYHTGVPVKTFMKSVAAFAEKVHADFPECKLFILSPDVRDEQPDYNVEMKKFIKKHPDYIEYVNMEGYKTKMGLAEYQKLLLPDNSHWNSTGYTKFSPIIREKLKDYKNN